MSLSIEPNTRVTFGTRFVDEHYVVIEKPAGTVTAPGKGHDTDSLLNGLFAVHGKALQNVGASRDFGLLQRLDREASGVMVVALTPSSWEAMREMFTKRSVRKYYWAIARRAPNQRTGVIRRPLEEYAAARDDVWIEDARRKKFAKLKLARISTRGKPAVTAFRTLSSNDSAAMLECRAMTGRLHQVRAHLDSIGCSILGDRFYGPASSRRATGRLSLHAHRLVFDHPFTGETVDVRTRCPRDMKRTARQLGLDTPGVFSPNDVPDADSDTSGSSVSAEAAQPPADVSPEST